MNANLKLSDVMSRRVVTVGETKTVREAAKVMSRHEIGSVVVTSRGKIQGIMTERDVLRLVAKGQNPDKVRVLQLMSRPVIVGEVDHDLPTAIKIMVLHKIKKLPVVRGKKLVGIVTLTDFARVGPLVQDMMMQAMSDMSSAERKQTMKRFEKYFGGRDAPPSFYA